MPRKIEASSGASKKKIDKAYSKIFESILKNLEAINNKLNEGKSLSDEESRFLKKSNSLITELQIREKATDAGPSIPPETLKKFITMFEREVELTGPISKEQREELFRQLGYWRCEGICGELHHESDSECPLLKLKSKSTD